MHPPPTNPPPTVPQSQALKPFNSSQNLLNTSLTLKQLLLIVTLTFQKKMYFVIIFLLLMHLVRSKKMARSQGHPVLL